MQPETRAKKERARALSAGVGIVRDSFECGCGALAAVQVLSSRELKDSVRRSAAPTLSDEGVGATLNLIEIARKIFRVEFTFDNAITAEQASISNVVPLRDQVCCDQNRLPALGLETQFVLKPFSPAGIEAKARLVEQKNRGVG